MQATENPMLRNLKTTISQLLFALLMAPLPTLADSFAALVGYVCDTDADELRLTYDGAYNQDGEMLLSLRSHTQWNPWDLTEAQDEDHVGTLKTVRAQCRLTDGTYDIEIAPVPGNMNVQRRCGATITASARVFKGGHQVYSLDHFDNTCRDAASPIVTRVLLGPRRAVPEVTSVSWSEFYQ